jgi:hypothetical protein
LAVAWRFTPLSVTAFSFHGDEDGDGVCHALVLVLARSGDAVDEQADEARLPHLARRGARRGEHELVGEDRGYGSIGAEEVGEEALAVARGDVGGARAGQWEAS